MNIPFHLVLFFLPGGSAIFIYSTAFSRRSSPGAAYLILLGVTLAVWDIHYAFTATGSAAKILIATGLSQFLASDAATFLFYFSLSFSNQSERITRRTLALLMVVPVITLAGTLLSIQSVAILFWINILYFNALIALAMYIVIKTFRHSPLPQRLQAGMILAGSVFILPASLISISLTPSSASSFALLAAFTIAGLAVSFGGSD